MALGVKPKPEALATGKAKSRELRHAVSEIKRKALENRDDYLEVGNDTLKKALVDLDKHSKKVSRAPDQALESDVFCHLVTLQTDMVSRFCASSSAVSPNDLAKTLVGKFGKPDADIDDMHPSDFDWVKFGESFASSLFRSTVCAQVDFMLGSVKAPAARKAAVRNQRPKPPPPAQARKPAELDVASQDDANETSKLTDEMFRRVQQHGKAPFCFFVLNHDSFAQTVENMFSVSMLVMSGKVALRNDPEWGMSVDIATLEKASSTGKVHARDRAANYSQMIVNMNFAIWEGMKAKVPHESCLTPHRDATAPRGGVRRSADGPLDDAPAGKRPRQS